MTLVLVPVWCMSQNRIGINTDTPFLDLDIRGDDDVWDGGELQLATPSMTHFIRMFGGREGDKNPFLAFRDIDTFHFVTTSPDWLTFKRRMTISPAGRIGIGEDNPLSTLHIHLADNTTNEYLRFSSHQNPLAWIFHQIHPTTGGLSLKTLSNNRNFQIVSSNGLNRALFITSNDTYSKVSLVPDGGEVGIGVLEANAKLHVVSDGTPSDPQLLLHEVTSGEPTTIKIKNGTEPSLFWDIRATTDVSPSSSLLRFYHNAAGNPATEKLSITGEGKVGIDLAQPSAKLDVNGKIKITDDADAPAAGMMRYNATTQDFEGYDGTRWLSLTVKGLTGGWGIPSLQVTDNEQVVAADGNAHDHFGSAVAISGNYAVVGAPFFNTNGISNEGKVYIYHYNGTQWVQNTTLTSLANQENAIFGYSVAIHNNYLVVGAPGVNVGGSVGQGKVYVYSLVNGVWEFQVSFSSSDGNSDDEFGSSVAISNNYIVVGAPSTSHNGYLNIGKAYVFQRTGSQWTQQAILLPTAGGNFIEFGSSVSISGDYLVVGSPREMVNGVALAGRAYVFNRSGSVWSLQSTLVPDEYTDVDIFGNSVSISNDHLVVGSFGHDGNGYLNTGAAYIFARNGSAWNQLQKLQPADLLPNTSLGRFVTIHGDYVLISSDASVNGIENLGKAYLYRKSGVNFNLMTTLLANGGQADDHFSYSAGISTTQIVIGAEYHDAGGQENSGKIYFYRNY